MLRFFIISSLFLHLWCHKCSSAVIHILLLYFFVLDTKTKTNKKKKLKLYWWRLKKVYYALCKARIVNLNICYVIAILLVLWTAFQLRFTARQNRQNGDLEQVRLLTLLWTLLQSWPPNASVPPPERDLQPRKQGVHGHEKPEKPEKSWKSHEIWYPVMKF